LMLICMGR